MDSRTRKTPLPSALRAVGTAVAATVVLGLTPSVAEATPRRPSDTQISQAQDAATAVENRIRELSGQLAAAQDDVAAAHARAAIALDEYQATRAAHEAAQQDAAAKAAAAAQATADLDVSREQVVAFARRSYMQGSTYPEAAALLTAADPGELVQRAALLEAAGGHRSDVLAEVRVLQARAVEAETVARAAVEQAAALQEHAATTLTAAKDAEVSARQQAAALDAQQAQLTAELTAAQSQLQTLVGERAAADRAAQVQVQARVQVPAPRPAPAPKPVTAPPAPAGNGAPAGSGNASAAQRAIDAAMDYLGTPYAWGGGGTRGPGPGEDPDKGVVGFDCSGLTQYAYGRAGISIPRNSRAQYAALPKVSSDSLRPGDLVFWARDTSDPDTIHHVAIWLGGERMLEAPQSGSVVKISDMRWRGYIGAVRPSA